MPTAAQLAAQIKHHNGKYWDDNDPEISDHEYDQLVRELTKLNPAHPILKALGPSPSTAGTRVAHAAPMLSLEKAYTEAEIRNWMQGKADHLWVSPKIDGVAASIHYEGGKLKLAVTRGDGVHGEDFTANAFLIPSIPNHVQVKGAFEVRGEIYMAKSVFEAKFATAYANTRNLTAGSIKSQSGRDRCKDLSFFAYGLYGTPSKSFQQDKEILQKLRFQPVPRLFARQLKLSEVMEAIEIFDSKKDVCHYDTDGAVVRVDSHAYAKSLGSTSHHPKHSIAFKWQTKAKSTPLEDTEWSLSRMAIITPVAILEGIELDGVTVRRATVHNLTQFLALDLHEGDPISVKRAGGVIPKIEANLRDGAPTGPKIPVPDKCPSCGSPTKVLKGNTADLLMCSVPESCRGVVEQRIEHFTKAMKMDGFGPSVCAGLYNIGVRLFANLFYLNLQDFQRMPKTGIRKAKQLSAEIETKRSVPLAKVLRALSVDGLGKKLSAQLGKVYLGDDPLRDVLVDARSGKLALTIQALDGQGTSVANRVSQGICESSFEIQALRRTLKTKPKVAVTGGPLADQSFVFTGGFDCGIKREELQQAVEDLGGDAPSGVKKGLTYLVLGGAGSDKYAGKIGGKEKKVAKYNSTGSTIQIIYESAFLDLMEGHGWKPGVMRATTGSGQRQSDGDQIVADLSF